MRIIGFDPANYKNLGWSSIETEENNGKITNIKVESGTFIFKEEGQDCLLPMHKKISSLITKVKPDVVTFEYTPFGKSFVAGQISQGIGVMILACQQKKVDMKKMSPSHVKKVITGDSKAKKSKMIKCTNHLMEEWGYKNYKFDSHHACDAAANCFCHLADLGLIIIGEIDVQR